MKNLIIALCVLGMVGICWGQECIDCTNLSDEMLIELDKAATTQAMGLTTITIDTRPPKYFLFYINTEKDPEFSVPIESEMVYEFHFKKPTQYIKIVIPKPGDGWEEIKGPPE